MWLKHTWAATAGRGSAPGCQRAGGQRSCAGALRKCSPEEFRVPVRGTASAAANVPAGGGAALPCPARGARRARPERCCRPASAALAAAYVSRLESRNSCYEVRLSFNGSRECATDGAPPPREERGRVRGVTGAPSTGAATAGRAPLSPAAQLLRGTCDSRRRDTAPPPAGRAGHGPRRLSPLRHGSAGRRAGTGAGRGQRGAPRRRQEAAAAAAPPLGASPRLGGAAAAGEAPSSREGLRGTPPPGRSRPVLGDSQDDPSPPSFSTGGRELAGGAGRTVPSRPRASPQRPARPALPT
ncbi:skin secretory protein xP2-like [Corvus moneduloides]|uniref:skin secretory protein xP2-like n=1 Tax=Corvus moneduloides TaxID=1196302 RepID=UPI0013639153|nr:skin secretory protein xP2-like [Corvus moneduloides]